MVEKEIAYIYKSKFIFSNSSYMNIVILIGDVSVGKTCLLTRYVKDTVSKH
jgi:GTPase SAR1 family protein